MMTTVRSRMLHNENQEPSKSPSFNPGRLLYLDSTWQALRLALQLSNRELEIAQAIFDDKRESQVAKDLGISVHTVHTYLKRLFQKLGARSRVEVVCIIVAHERRLTGREQEPRKTE